MRAGAWILLLVATRVFAQNAIPDASPDAASRYEGQAVREVRFDPEAQALSPEEFEEAGILRVGDPFRAEAAALTIDRLFATGFYTDIQVAVEQVADGVSVRILTQAQWFVGHISIQGDARRSPSRQELANVTQLRLGEPLHEEDVREAEQRLHRLLTNNGLFEHEFKVTFEDVPDVQQRNVNVLVETGPRAKYAPPTIQGSNGELSDNAILRATGWTWIFGRIYRKVTQERTNKGSVAVQRRYETSGWLMAEVGLSERKYEPERRRLHFTIDVDPGPKVEVRAAENAVRRRTLRRYVPVFEEMAVDQDLLVEGATNLRDYFQSKGYFDATVDFRQEQPDDDHLTVEYVIDAGPRSKLVSVAIQGHRFFSTSDLRERMFLQESGLIRFRHGRFSQTFLARDKEAIENLYHANGFRDVLVTSAVQNDFKGRPGEVGVTFTVTEGPLWTVSSLNFSGLEHFTRETLEAVISSTQGQPYSEVNVARDRDVILTLYRDAGYPDAGFQFLATPDSETHQVSLIYAIAAGNRQTVREVVVSGIQLTNLRMVERRITLNPGDPLSQVQMSAIQQRLYNLGVFARVDVAVQNQAGGTPSKRVLYDFREASRYSLALGFGAEFARIGGTTSDISRPEGSPGISPRISVDLSRLNLWGLGHTVSLRGRASNLEQLASLQYLAPRFQNVDGRNLTITGGYQESRDVRTFTAHRLEASAQITQQISRAVTVMGRIAYRRVSVSEVVIPGLLIPQLLQPVRIGILSGNVVQDRRDNPTDSKRGIYNTLDLGIASNWFGSQRNFVRFLGRNATYHPLSKNVILARETAFGVIIPFAVPPGVPLSDAIPLPERFYGGGSQTHRGFPENQAGPRDTGERTVGPPAPATGFPLGGNALLFNQIELRFPMLGDNIGGVLFHDMGNIYDRIGNISFRVRQRNQQDFNYMVHAVGYGIRYRTPVGPIRVDLAYSINPPRYQGFEGTTADLLACGATGEFCSPVDRRISHFQFFVSIGQTF